MLALSGTLAVTAQRRVETFAKTVWSLLTETSLSTRPPLKKEVLVGPQLLPTQSVLSVETQPFSSCVGCFVSRQTIEERPISTHDFYATVVPVLLLCIWTSHVNTV